MVTISIQSIDNKNYILSFFINKYRKEGQKYALLYSLPLVLNCIVIDISESGDLVGFCV